MQRPPEPTAQVYAIKTYKHRDGHKNHDRETEAFKRMIGQEAVRYRGVIEFYGGFLHRGHFSIVLEFAEGGTLEELLMYEHEPTKPAQIMGFWTAMFELFHGLSWIHSLHRPSSNSIGEESEHG